MRCVMCRIYVCLFALACAAVAQCAPAPEDRWVELQQEGSRLRQSGNYAAARRVYQDALRMAESSGAAGDRMAQTLNNLGAACYDGGQYAEAETYYRRAMQIWKRNESPETDRDLASLWGNLAALYAASGKQKEAEPLYLNAIDLTRGPAEESVTLRITLMNNLA